MHGQQNIKKHLIVIYMITTADKNSLLFSSYLTHSQTDAFPSVSPLIISHFLISSIIKTFEKNILSFNT